MPDNDAAVARFRELLQLPTVSHADETEIEWEPFDAFVAALPRLYPRTHERLEREIVDGHSLLYRWPGAAASDPLVLMAHYDVVPVVEEEWDRPPFAAEIVGDGVDAAIHARGAIDDKGSLVAILEAVEQLAGSDFRPARDVYLSFGHNEETAGGGARGARRAGRRATPRSRRRAARAGPRVPAGTRRGQAGRG